jgi:hypothetical protein
MTSMADFQVTDHAAAAALEETITGRQAEEQIEKEVEAEAQRQAIYHAGKERFRARLAGPAKDDAGQYLSRAELGDLPRPAPLIEGVLNRHSYAILRGRDGTYKSFLALDWALSLATGRQWQGRPTERGRVLYIAGEGVFGLQPRIQAWEARHGKVPTDALTVRKSAVNLHRGGQPLERLLAHVRDGDYALVIIDTLRRASGGADGNGSDMGVVVDNIDLIKQATADGSVLVIAHTNKGDNDTRGFSGIEDDADIVWSADKREGRVLKLRLTKMKDGPDGTTFTLTPESVLDSLVLSRPESGAGRLDSDRPILTLLEKQAVPMTREEINSHLGGTVSRATIFRRLPELATVKTVAESKKGRSMAYSIP